MKKYPEQDEYGWYWQSAYADATDKPSMLYGPIYSMLYSYHTPKCPCGNECSTYMKLRKWFKTEGDARHALERVLKDIKRMYESTNENYYSDGTNI